MKKILLLIIVIQLSFLCCSDLLLSSADQNNPFQELILYPIDSSHIYATGFLLTWSKEPSDKFFAYKVYIDTIAHTITPDSKAYYTTLLKADTMLLVNGLNPATTYYGRIIVFGRTTHRASTERSIQTKSCTSGIFNYQIENSMVLIPAGSFRAKDSGIGSITHHFYMDTTEVTEAQWAAVMYDSISSSQRPQTNISWYNVILYCNKKSKKDHFDTCYVYKGITYDTSNNTIKGLIDLYADFTANGFRLPTEDEWEYACRSGVGTDFFWGKNLGTVISPDGDTTSYPLTPEDTLEISGYIWWIHDGVSTPQDVAQKKPNPWHLYDMLGNVEEFIWDCLSTQPKARINYTGPESGYLKVIRGGSLMLNLYDVNCYVRHAGSPDVSNIAVGFRTVRIQ